MTKAIQRTELKTFYYTPVHCPFCGTRVMGADPVGVSLPDLIHPGDRLRLADVLAAVRGGEGTQEGLDFRAVGRRRHGIWRFSRHSGRNRG